MPCISYPAIIESKQKEYSMAVDPSTNVSQSQALTAYITQQQQGTPRPRDRDNQSVDASRSTQPKLADQVSFTPEALRLSTQNGQDNSRNTVNKTQGSAPTKPQQQAPAPEVVRAEGAKSVAQAINAYHTTMKT